MKVYNYLVTVNGEERSGTVLAKNSNIAEKIVDELFNHPTTDPNGVVREAELSKIILNHTGEEDWKDPNAEPEEAPAPKKEKSDAK